MRHPRRGGGFARGRGRRSNRKKEEVFLFASSSSFVAPFSDLFINM